MDLLQRYFHQAISFLFNSSTRIEILGFRVALEASHKSLNLWVQQIYLFHKKLHELACPIHVITRTICEVPSCRILPHFQSSHSATSIILWKIFQTNKNIQSQFPCPNELQLCLLSGTLFCFSSSKFDANIPCRVLWCLGWCSGIYTHLCHLLAKSTDAYYDFYKNSVQHPTQRDSPGWNRLVSCLKASIFSCR